MDRVVPRPEAAPRGDLALRPRRRQVPGEATGSPERHRQQHRQLLRPNDGSVHRGRRRHAADGHGFARGVLYGREEAHDRVRAAVSRLCCTAVLELVSACVVHDSGRS